MLTILESISGTNVLLLDRDISALVNHLTPFSTLKATGAFSDTAWLDEPPPLTYDGVIAVCYATEANLEQLQALQAKRLHIIVPNLPKSFTYRVNKAFGGNSTLEDILEQKEPRVGYRVKLHEWKVPYVLIDGAYVVNEPMKTYLTQPMAAANHLADAIVSAMAANELKLKNVHAKGDLSAFVVRNVQTKWNEHLSSKSPLELEYEALTKRSNTDLVVVERNLDWVSVVSSQLTYGGLIDDLFGIEYGRIKDKDTNAQTVLTDTLFPSLCHLNFSTVGQKINQMAREVQAQCNLDSDSLDEMKRIASTLGTLAQRQELVKKHTGISEKIVSAMGKDPFLSFQQDLFETDYKAQVASVLSFIETYRGHEQVLAAIVLVSAVNDGLKASDYDAILDSVMSAYGLHWGLVLEKLHDYGVVRIVEQVDFFGRSHQQDPDPSLVRFGNVYTATYALVDKFWNLHPEADMPDASGDSLATIYQQPSYALPSGMVPLLVRFIEALYTREFLKYKPSNSTKRRPNWDNLPLAQMFKGKQIDESIDDQSDKQRVHDKSETLLVGFVGGVTRAEVSCLEHLGERIGRRVVVVGSGVVGRREFISNL